MRMWPSNQTSSMTVEGFLFRSDHIHYAQLNVPSLYFTTKLHDDHHAQFDDPARVDYGKLTRKTKWMYATGRRVAKAQTRPALDPGFELERRR
jgi:hypothetical protein